MVWRPRPTYLRLCEEEGDGGREGRRERGTEGEREGDRCLPADVNSCPQRSFPCSRAADDDELMLNVLRCHLTY